MQRAQWDPSSNIGAAKIEKTVTKLNYTHSGAKCSVKTNRSNDQFKLKSTAKTLHHVVTAIMMLWAMPFFTRE